VCNDLAEAMKALDGKKEKKLCRNAQQSDSGSRSWAQALAATAVAAATATLAE